MNHVYRLKRSGRIQQLQPVPETARAAGKGSRTSKTLAQTVGGTLASVALSGMASLAYAQQAPPAVNQLPQGGVVARGSASIHTGTTSAGNALMTVNQASNRAVIDWTSFNVGSQAKVQFNQPSSSAVTLNNILGNNASQIYGQISANGQVFLSNPNGVYFSPAAQVNVGGLVATTGKANADEFMAGKASFNRAGSTGSVVNEGQLTSAAGGYIALLAPEVRNQGVVVAQAGTVALASGEAITLSFNNSGTGLAGITTTPQAIAALVENRSAVLTEGGQIILSAHALAALQGSVVKNSGQLSATSLTEKGGKIVLMADSIELTGTSRIEANGPTGGGTVVVGGDWQGSGDTRQAVQVTMSQGASIEANATLQGDGGKVVLWSDVHNADSQTTVAGSISAEGRGANTSGGQIETSGARLRVADSASIRMGGEGATGGRWLLDPTDFTIAATGGDITGAALAASISAGSTVEVLSSSGASGTAGNINVNDSVSWNNTGILKLTAVGGITGSGNIVTGGASSNLTINQAGNSTYSGVISGSGSVTKLGAGTLTLSGANTYTGDTTVSAGTLALGASNVLTSTGALTVSGGTLSLGAFNNSVGAVSIGTSGGSITSTTGVLTGSGYTFNNTSAATVSAILAGTGSLTQSGSGTTTLSGANTYTGGTNFNSGKLVAGSSGAFGSSGTLTFGGGTLGYGYATDFSARFSTVANQVYSVDTGSLSVTWATSLNGSGASLIKSGTGVLTLNASNSLSGGVTVQQGTLFLGNAAGLGTGSVVVNTGGAIDLNGKTVTSANPLSLSGTGTGTSGALRNTSTTSASFNGLISLAGHTTIGTTADGGGLSLSHTGAITGAGFNLTINGIWFSSTITLAGSLSTGSGELIKAGFSKLVLSGTNNYSGGTTLSAGILSISDDRNLGAVPATPTVNLTLAGTLLFEGQPTALVLSSNRSIVLTGNTTLQNTSNTATATIANAITGSANLTIGGLGTVLKIGSATAFASGAITVETGNTLDLNGQTLTSTGALSLKGTGVNNSGALMNSGAAATYAGLVSLGANSSIVAGTGAINLSNPGIISGSRTLTLGGAAGGSIASIIGTNTGTLTKKDAGTWTLSGANTYTGATTVSAGVLKAGNANAFGPTSGAGAITVSSGAALDLNGQAIVSTGPLTLNGTGISNGGALMNSGAAASYAGQVTLGSDSSIIGGSGSIALGNTGTTINGSGKNLILAGAQGGSIAGIIGTGAGTLTKQDTGTWALTGVNTFTGMVTVNAGTLQIATDSGLGAVPSTAAVKLTLNGGTLASNNSIDVTLNANRLIAIGSNGGSIVNAGTSTSTLSLEGAIGGATVGSVTQGPLTITGGDIRIGVNIKMGPFDLLVKSTGNIFQGVATTNPTPANVVVSTLGAGHVTYWADSDASGAGAIQLRSGSSNSVRSSITTAGGNIVLGGGSGATAADGWARGLYAVNLGSYSNLDAGTGSITLKGMTNATSWGGTGVLIDTNSTLTASTIRITGNGNPTNTFSDFGVFLKGGTSVTASSLVNITGTGGGTASSAALANTGVRFDDVTVSATGSGNVVITGDGGGNAAGGTNYGIQLLGNIAGNRSSISADTGTITMTGMEGASAGGIGISATVARIGAASQTGLITVRANSLLTGFLSTAANNSQVLSSGVVNMEPLLGSASFTGRALDLTYMQFGSSISSLTLGKSGNTGAVIFGTPNTNGNIIAGPITAHGGIQLVNDTASSTGVTLNGSVLQTAGRLSTPTLLLTGTGASNVSLAFSSTYGNAIATVAGSGLGTVNINNGGTLSSVAAGALTVGTVGSTHGLSASGPVSITTYRGDITLADNIVTSNAGTAAITLNPGQYMPVGDTTSGNLIFNNGVSLTTGSGGRALLYTGAVSNAGLTALVGSGSGRFRYGSTSSINNFTNWLGTSGLYAIYRERPTASWSSTASQTFNYGNTPVIDTTGSVSGLVNGDTADTSMTVRLASTNVLTSTNARGFYNVGSYIFSRTEGAKALGYQVSNPTMTVNRATLTVTANDFTKTYDGVKFSGGKGVTYSGFATGETAVNALSGSVSYGGTAQNVVDASASTYSIVPSGLSANNYTITYVSGALTVNPATLTVRINNEARFVADSETAGYNGASYSGFVAKQTESVLGGALTISRSSSGPDGNLAGANTQPGTYTGALTGSGLTSTNYTLNYVPGNYTIVPADQLLVKMANVSATYGSDPAYSVTSARYYRSSNSTIYDLTSSVVLVGSSFSLNDGAGGNTAFTLGATTPALSTAGQLNVGAYQVGAASITNTSINYSNTITVTGSLQVNPKPVTAAVTSSVSKAYDGTPAMNGLTLAVSGDVTGDAVSASGSGAYASKNAGNPVAYSVSNIALSGADARNYVLTDSVTTQASNTLTGSNGVITAVPLNITAKNDSKTYDGNAYSGSNGVTYSGFVNNETEADLSGSLSYGGTSQGATSVAANYTIVPSGYSSSNYTISYANGTLSITPVVLSVTPITGTLQGSVSKVYDGDNTATLSASNYLLTGWATGEGATVTKTSGTYDNANAGSNKTVTVTLVDADYTANVGTTLSNYTLPTSISGAVGSISKAALTATGNSASVTYNGANQTVNGFTLSGLQGNDTLDSLTSVAASGVTGKNADSYVNTVTAGLETNYTVTPVNGSLVIARAALTATANSAQVTYNGANQSVNGFTVSGLKGNDTEAVLTGISASGVTGFNVGSYVNTMTVVDQTNYTVTGVNGSLRINAAPITAIQGALQGSVSKVYDSTTAATLSSSHYLLTGWLGSDMATVTKTAGTFDTANAGSGKTVTVLLTPSDYQANGSTNLSNYALPTTVSGAVGQITKASVTPTITASDKVYDTTTVANGAVALTGVYSADASAASAVAAGYSFANANVGTGKTVTASGITLGAGLTDNYVLSSTTATGTASITPAPVTVTANNAARFVTQTDTANFGGYAVTGLLDSETPASAGITAGVSLSRSNAAVNLAGVYPGVLVPSGAAVIGNYAVSYVPGTFTIVPAGQLLVETTITNTTYGTSSFNPIASVSYLDASNYTINPLTLGSQAVVNGATVYTYNDGANGTASFTIAPTGTMMSASGQLRVGSYGLVSGNFSKTTGNLQSNTATVTGNLTVQPLAITVAATPSSTTYNSTTQTQAHTSGVLGGDAVTVSGAVRQRNAGSYTSALSATGADVGNYSITYDNSNFTINPAVLTTSVSAADKVYDGSTSASLTLTDNRFSGDAVSVTARGQFADKNVGASKSVAITGLTLSGADASNYSLSAPASTTAAITRLAQVTWVGGTTGNWFDPANWAGGAVPDLANVANVTIPAGVTVSFDNVAVSPAQTGPVNVDSLGTAGSLALSAGSLNVGAGGVTLNTLMQTGGALATTGSVALGSLSQSAGSLSAGSLSTTTAYSQSGSGTIAVTGDVAIAATAAPVVLGNLSTGGILNVSSTGGSITQTAGTVLTVTGPATLTASQGGAAADVTLDNAGNALNGPVTATGADVKLRTTGALTASVTATGNATLTSGGSTTLGATTVGGDLQVTTANANVTQTGPVAIGGTTTLNAGTGAVQLTDAGNRFTGAVSVTAASKSITGAPDVSTEMDQAPQVLSRVVQVSLPYQVTLIQLPQGDASGQVHIEIQNAIGDVQMELPSALKNWIAAAGADVALENRSAAVLDDVHLADNGATLKVRASVDRSIPLEFVIRAGREQVTVRIVWKP